MLRFNFEMIKINQNNQNIHEKEINCIFWLFFMELILVAKISC